MNLIEGNAEALHIERPPSGGHSIPFIGKGFVGLKKKHKNITCSL